MSFRRIPRPGVCDLIKRGVAGEMKESFNERKCDRIGFEFSRIFFLIHHEGAEGVKATMLNINREVVLKSY